MIIIGLSLIIATVFFLVQKRSVPQKIQKLEITQQQISGWNTLKNQNGWQVQYPPGWKTMVFSSVSASISAEKAGVVAITGPQGCFINGPCGTITFNSFLEQTASISAMIPKDYQLKYFISVAKDQFEFFSNREVTVGTLTGNEIVFGLKTPGDFGRQITKLLTFKNGGKIFTISVNESTKDPKTIKSISDWTMRTLYDQILSTFKFNE